MDQNMVACDVCINIWTTSSIKKSPIITIIIIIIHRLTEHVQHTGDGRHPNAARCFCGRCSRCSGRCSNNSGCSSLIAAVSGHRVHRRLPSANQWDRRGKGSARVSFQQQRPAFQNKRADGTVCANGNRDSSAYREQRVWAGGGWRETGEESEQSVAHTILHRTTGVGGVGGVAGLTQRTELED